MSRQKSAGAGGVRAVVVMRDWKPAAIALSAAEVGGVGRAGRQPTTTRPTAPTTRAKRLFAGPPARKLANGALVWVDHMRLTHGEV
jgi:hypothetical protein